MYLQIIIQIKNRVAVGEWEPGYKLPSIRELAVLLKVSVITIKRAYQELETEGVIVTQQGKGSFIAATSNLSLKLREQDMDEHLLAVVKIAESMNLSPEALIQRLEQMIDEHKKSEEPL